MHNQAFFYSSPRGRLGDIIPYYENGEFRLFYLGDGWNHVSTRDQLHFYNEYSTAIQGGTGSVIALSSKSMASITCFTASFPWTRSPGNWSAMPPAWI